tara:strand:- start:2462 stop:3082 length:621 start_codon:yes stop_codon:yes gene_type:complete
MTETLRKDEALFIPSDTDTEEYIPKVAGEYLGHITEASTLTREFKNRDGELNKALIFNFKVLVAHENTRNTYQYIHSGETHTTNGAPYVGAIFQADGVFRFLEPTGGDHFVSNSEGNKRYMRFCETVGVTIDTEERTVNGRTIKVKVLPELKTSDIEGTPVIASVDRGNDWVNSDGETRPSWKVKYVKTWSDGKRLALTTTNDLPF